MENINITIETLVSIVAVVISFFAFIVTVYYSHKNNKQYLKSLEPLLSFKLIEFNKILYLKITNTGKSAANNIVIEIKKIENNGDMNDLILDELFCKEFELYPNESTQGRIGVYGGTINTSVFPKIYLSVKYVKGVTNKQILIDRMVIFSPAYENKIYGDFNIDLRELNRNMNVLAKANLRTANYLDGCQVAPFDELNILAGRSLHDDLRSVKEGANESTVRCRPDVIRKSL